MLLRKHREDQYQKLVDAVYKRRGWTKEGVPTMETIKKFKLDFPEVLALVEPLLAKATYFE